MGSEGHAARPTKQLSKRKLNVAHYHNLGHPSDKVRFDTGFIVRIKTEVDLWGILK